MTHRPGDTFYASFTTQSLGGASTDADATPAVALRRNGATDAAVSVSVTRNAAGDYTASAQIPLTYSGGDALELVITAAVGGVTGKAIVPLGTLDRTAQSVAQVLYRSDRVHFVSAGGHSTGDGLSPETAKALPSQPAAGPGETILLFSGTFALGAAALDLSGDGATGVHLRGAGMGATAIASDALLADGVVIVKPGNGSIVSDLTVQATAATAGTTDQYQGPFGATSAQTPFVNATLRRVRLLGDSDGIYLNLPGSLNSLRAEACFIQTRYDAINLLSAAGSWFELHGCHLDVSGPSTCNGGTTARAMVVRGGTLGMFGGTISAAGASATTRGVQVALAGTANLYGVEVGAAAASGTVYDLENSGTALSVYDCAYAPGKTLGVVGGQNIPGTLAPSQDFNNTGQVAPVPSAAAFAGAVSATLVFHDAGGNPVPGVVFNVVGVGSAVADAAGSRTVALAPGAYTIRALPMSGTLWADTPISVAADATFNLVGTAIAIPPPSDPAQTTAYLTTRDGQGTALPGVTLTFQMIDPQAPTDSYNTATFSATSDALGALQIALLKNTRYQARVGAGAWVSFTTGGDSTFALPEILGAE